MDFFFEARANGRNINGMAASGDTPDRPAMRWVRATYRVLHGWWERERLRRELSTMRAPDFGDLTVPPSLVIEELRRWPWQKQNSQWERSQRGGAAAMPRMARTG